MLLVYRPGVQPDFCAAFAVGVGFVGASPVPLHIIVTKRHLELHTNSGERWPGTVGGEGGL